MKLTLKSLLKIVLCYLTFFSLNSSLFSQIVVGSNNNNLTFNTCSDFIIDSGGEGGPGYSNNENITITICPETPADEIYVQFTLFSLDPFGGSNDRMLVHDGNTIGSPLIGNYTGFELEGIVNQASIGNASKCLTFHFISDNTGTGRFAGNVSCTPPCSPPMALSTVVGQPLDSIAICVGQELSFSDNGSSSSSGFSITDYEWDFRDGNTANGQTVNHTFNTPGLYRVKLTVTDDNNCSSLNSSSLRIYVAPIPDFSQFPLNQTICINETVEITATPQLYETTWTGFPSSSEIEDGCVDDNQVGVTQTTSLELGGFTSGATLDDINDLESICIELEHSFMGDFVLQVRCSTGQTVTLHQQGGGGTHLGEPVPEDNVDCDAPSTIGVGYQYCFTTSATQTWEQASAAVETLPAGNYASIQPLTNLLGCPLNGSWSILFTDNWGGDDGTLFSFSINVNPNLYEDIEEFSIEINEDASSSYWPSTAQFGTLSNNNNTLTITPTTSGTFDYTYNIIDNFGCTNNATYSLTVLDRPTADAGLDSTICTANSTGTIQLEGSGSNWDSSCSYTLLLEDSWGDGWSGNTITVGINGNNTNYTITNGTTNEIDLLVANNDILTLQFNNTGNFVDETSFVLYDCDGNLQFQSGQNDTEPSTALQTFTVETEPEFVYSWSAPTNLNNANIYNPTATVTNQETFTLTIHPVGFPTCLSSDDVTITVTENNDAGVNGQIMLCETNPLTDLHPTLGPTAILGGTWTSPNSTPVSMPYNPATMPAGLYTYSIYTNNCLATATVEVIISNPQITEILTTNVDCNSANNGAVIINANETNLQYSIDNGVTFSPTNTFQNLAPGNYTVLISNNQNCQNTGSFSITQPDPISIVTISPDTSICSGDTVTLAVTASGGSSPYNYTWTSNGSPLSTESNFQYSPTITSTACVTVSETCGSPSATECVTIDIISAINTTITPNINSGCLPLEVTFTNTNTSNTIAHTLITFGDQTSTTATGQSTIDHLYIAPGVYSIEVTNTSVNGCVFTSSFDNLVQVYSNPTADFRWNPVPPRIFNPIADLIDQSSNDVVYWEWNFEDGSPLNSILQNPTVNFPLGVVGEYDVSLFVMNENGCSDSITRTIAIESELTLFAPNTFTPDGDKFNEKWRVYIDGIDIYKFNLLVFNRWGETVWESNNPDGEWDGTYGGIPVNDGIYIWTITAKDQITDENYKINGHLNVIR